MTASDPFRDPAGGPSRTLAPRARRVLSLWLPRLGAERALRRGAADPDAPFAVAAETANALTLVSVNAAAEALGLAPGMPLTDARAIHPGLVSVPHDPAAEARFAAGLLRWAGRFSPWAAPEDGPAGEGGLALDVTGCAHLFGGEAELSALMLTQLSDLGLTARIGVADTRGAAWAAARFAVGPRAPLDADRSGDAISQDARATRVRTPPRRAARGRKGWERGRAVPPPAAAPAADGAPAVIVPRGALRAALAPLPVSALRISADTAQGLSRLGLRSIGDLAGTPRGALARRFGADLTRRLDQALGAAPDPISPARAAPSFAVRLTLPEPVGLRADIEAALDRLLERLCAKLEAEGRGARRLRLAIRRVDRAAQGEEVGLARPSRDPARIRPLFERALDRLEAGFGVDAVRLEATATEPLAARQHRGHFEARAEAQARAAPGGGDDFAELLGRIGARIGLERLVRFLPADSHIPERTARIVAAAWSEARETGWPGPSAVRPVLLVEPEPAAPEPDGGRREGGCAGSAGWGRRAGPPARLRWRGRTLRLLRAAGPERIAPEWWLDDPAWRSGLRDYWRVETEAGERLWLFRTRGAEGASAPGGWFVHGVLA